jgi:predicted TPR repeat methyltransferase
MPSAGFLVEPPYAQDVRFMGQKQSSPDTNARNQVLTGRQSLLDELNETPQETPPEGTNERQIRAFVKLAMDHHQNGRLAVAEQMYRQVLRWQPDNADAYHLLGLLAAQLDEFDDALALFARAIELDSKIPEFHANRGNVLRIKSMLDEAEAAFACALSLRPDFPEALMNLATVRRIRGDPEGAEKLLRRSLELRAHWPAAQINLANVVLARGSFEEAMTLYVAALEAEPRYVNAYESLARAAARCGRTAEAAAAFQRLLAIDPGNINARYLLAACLSDPDRNRAPEDYIRRLFNDYAPRFDESMDQLRYCAPRLIAERLTSSVAPDESRVVLDAGCGTGLCGPLLKPYARHLVGVDLSAGMLAEAAKRSLYDELVEAELGQYLAEHRSTFDIIASADTLVYAGHLNELIAAAAGALKTGGHFLCTLEALPESPQSPAYQLMPSGRFSHSAVYVCEVLEDAGLTVTAVDRVVPRFEGGQPVQGLAVAGYRAR